MGVRGHKDRLEMGGGSERGGCGARSEPGRCGGKGVMLGFGNRIRERQGAIIGACRDCGVLGVDR